MRSAVKAKTRSMVYTALMTALIAVCAWITVPFTVPFTMQTFGVTLAVKLLGGKRGTAAILLYITLGGIGVPVFAGFTGGPAVLFGPTGGYILGFLTGALAYLALERFTQKIWCNIAVTGLMLIICYAFGTVWFMSIMASRQKAIGVASALSLCVIPYIIPDIVKLVLADVIGRKLRKFIHL